MHKKISLLLFSAILIFGLNSCVKSPEACFTPSKLEVDINEEVSFRNCSENAKIYDWSFGDGGFSEEESPKHTYTRAGDFTVTLTASGNLNFDETSVDLHVNGYNTKFTGIWTGEKTENGTSESATIIITEGDIAFDEFFINNLIEFTQITCTAISANSFEVNLQPDNEHHNFYGSGTLINGELSLNITRTFSNDISFTGTRAK